MCYGFVSRKLVLAIFLDVTLLYIHNQKTFVQNTFVYLRYFSIYREREQREVMSRSLVRNRIDRKKCLSLILTLLSYKTNQLSFRNERETPHRGTFPFFFFLQVYDVLPLKIAERTKSCPARSTRTGHKTHNDAQNND